MRFKFPLQKVLEHRKVLEDVAQRDFQEAAAELKKQSQNLESMKIQMTEAYEQAFRAQHSSSGQTSAQLKQIHDFILGQKVCIRQQEAKIQECEKLVEERREILRDKAVDYKIIERLRDRKKEDHEKETRLREQKELDEISVLRSVHRNRT